MELMHLYERKSFKYVDSCRDLDQHEYLGRVKLTPPRLVRESEGFDDGGTYVRFARLPAGADKARFMAVLAENLSKWGCTCERDCCGCFLVSATVTPTDCPRNVHISVRVGFNY